ncbi:MAG: sulfite exporter TauE/SafE family protein, partial [Desulfovibrionales bacterium]|nr:sulfite exporter TauE/SafE family protein [Desulfovibrionales bacterium]
MYFPVANVEVSWWVPSVVAFFVSLFTSTAGVSGAFLLLPFQMSFLGYTTPSVSATNHIFNIVAIPSGVYRYIREKRMVWPLSFVVILGTLPGVILGALIRVVYLPDPQNFKIFAALILGYIGIRMLKDVLKNKKIQMTNKEKDKQNISAQAVETLEMSWQRISYRFSGQVYSS